MFVTNRTTLEEIDNHLASAETRIVVISTEKGNRHGEAVVQHIGASYSDVRVVFGTHPRESQLAGALIVDPPGAPTDDRIFVISIWEEAWDTLGDSTQVVRNVLAINGKAWPYTERMRYTVGDSAHWRVINASGRVHPKHLHGFYFRVTSLGGLASDTTYAPVDERLVVTESMLPQSSMAMAFQAREEGHWLFHCHLIFHVSPEANLTWPDGTPAGHDSTMHIGGGDRCGRFRRLDCPSPPAARCQDNPDRCLWAGTQSSLVRG